jgi:hypothetical protein
MRDWRGTCRNFPYPLGNVILPFKFQSINYKNDVVGADAHIGPYNGIIAF